MKQLITNLKKVFLNWKYLLLGIIIFSILTMIFFYFTEFTMIRGNLGESYLWQTIVLQMIVSFLFSIFVPVSVYKIVEFKKFSIKESGASGAGTFLSILVAGCPACSITIATYLGLASVVSFLPWYGLELKYIAVPLLLYANYSILNNLETCKIKK